MSGLILVAGEALVDLIPEGTAEAPLFRPVLGGSPFNVALALARLGAPSAYAGRLSLDAMGERFAGALGAAGVDLSLAVRDARPSPLALVTRDGDGSASYGFYLAGTAYDGEAPLGGPWPDGVAHLHVGSFAALDERHGPATLKALSAFAGTGSTSYDPNIRPALMPGRAETLRRVTARVGLAGVVKASEEDLAWLYPGRDPLDAAHSWSLLGPRLTVVTRGAAGAVAFAAGKAVAVPAPAVAVADTVGAGDCFMAALLAAMHRDGALVAGAEPPTRVAVVRWLTFAVAAAAIVCARQGADPPLLAEVERALAA
ncbi:carbohydrate kinase [Chelatococcus sp. SYSU_G07232]|uniref:Carbohydrate kinase n=1 Tax=Chelatococcus albus TaxID=3047466 RepID=A0ABT7AJH1_9HYPH|nr:carbohydrate kinase [Chelatococcus sp. SYSU_G07232]MDJ1159518.1 carbohydrate kinase [Chelatococcus sp. SYSU_G07232]